MPLEFTAENVRTLKTAGACRSWVWISYVAPCILGTIRTEPLPLNRIALATALALLASSVSAQDVTPSDRLGDLTPKAGPSQTTPSDTGNENRNSTPPNHEDAGASDDFEGTIKL